MIMTFKKNTRYSSLLSDEGRVLHIHHTGALKGEIHLDTPFWKKNANIKELCKLLSTNYSVTKTENDIVLGRKKR